MLPSRFEFNDPFQLVLKKHEPPQEPVPGPVGPKHDFTCLAESDVAPLRKKNLLPQPTPTVKRAKLSGGYTIAELARGAARESDPTKMGGGMVRYIVEPPNVYGGRAIESRYIEHEEVRQDYLLALDIHGKIAVDGAFQKKFGVATFNEAGQKRGWESSDFYREMVAKRPRRRPG